MARADLYQNILNWIQHISVALLAVTGLASRNNVVNGILASLRNWDDMIYGHLPRLSAVRTLVAVKGKNIFPLGFCQSVFDLGKSSSASYNCNPSRLHSFFGLTVSSRPFIYLLSVLWVTVATLSVSTHSALVEFRAKPNPFPAIAKPVWRDRIALPVSDPLIALYAILTSYKLLVVAILSAISAYSLEFVSVTFFGSFFFDALVSALFNDLALVTVFFRPLSGGLFYLLLVFLIIVSVIATITNYSAPVGKLISASIAYLDHVKFSCTEVFRNYTAKGGFCYG